MPRKHRPPRARTPEPAAAPPIAPATPPPITPLRPRALGPRRAAPPGVPPRSIAAPGQAAPPAPTAGTNLQGDNSAPIAAYQSPDPGEAGRADPAIFAPGDPLRPIPGLADHQRPRQFAYPVGTNITPEPRHDLAVSFDELRNLAQLYEGCQIAEKAIYRIVRRLDLRFAPRAEYLAAGEDGASARWRGPARAMRDWFDAPDRRLDLQSWLIAAMRDNLQLDAIAIYHRRDRLGRLYGLELVDGATIAPLLDVGGRRPAPPAPAYAQVLYGVVGQLLTAQDLDYLVEHPRTDSPYGTSPVESIILRVNSALRKGHYDLTRFTDGATPAGVMQASDPRLVGMKADDLQTLEDLWNAILAGNAEQRVRTKFVPPGWQFTSLREEQIATDFDRWLLNLTAAAYGLTMDELGFTENSNRSVGDSQERVIYRNAVQPRASFIARYLDRVLRRYDGQPIDPHAAALSAPGRSTRAAYVWDSRYQATWTGVEEPEDFNRKAAAAALLVKSGILRPDEARQWLKLPREIPRSLAEDDL